MLKELISRFEEAGPSGVMARVALERAMSPRWVDEVFEAKRQRQYPKELLFSTVLELMGLVVMGLRPSLHAAARKAEGLPVSLAALYDKVKRTEPQVLRGLVQGSAERLMPVVEPMLGASSLPGWQVRIVDGSHLPASEKRLKPLRELRGAALPGQTLVVYDPDNQLVCDIVACEDAHAQERSVMPALVAGAQAGQVWIADRNFCTAAIMQGWHDRQAHFIVREHATHPVLAQEGELGLIGAVQTGQVHEQAIWLKEGGHKWRRIEVRLEAPTQAGDSVIRLWSNLPEQVTARQIAELYRKRWRIEGMFQRLESVLHSEIATLSHPRAALLGFAAAVLAYNVLAVLKLSVEYAHRRTEPTLDVSTFHLLQFINDGLRAMSMVLPPDSFDHWSDAAPDVVTRHLLKLAARIEPWRVRSSKRGPKKAKPKGAVPAAVARRHFSTARLLKQLRTKTP